MHPRQTIRSTVVSAITGLATTKSRVNTSRINPYTTLPALNVTTLSEDVREEFSCMGASGDEFRELRLVVEGRAKSVSGPNDTLDTMVSEVEEALLNSTTVRALVTDITIQSMAFSNSRDGSIPIGMVEMIFSILYQT